MDNIIEIDSSKINIDDIGNDIYVARNRYATSFGKKESSDVTIYLQAYNNLEKTKRCIESVLKYTKDVYYELLLIDNGSNDGTFEYFKTIDFPNKTIMHISDNKGSAIPQLFINMDMFSKYVVLLANDIIVTSKWLSNMIKVADSDPKIGLVNPMSSNVSNLQDAGLVFSDYDDMQEKAKEFNVSDPRKWEERLKIITLGTLFRKECLLAIGLPIADVGFAHNFSDDDISFQIRRAGYRIILAGDTWVHHDDDKKLLDKERAQRLNNDLDIGRGNFKDKYFGIDAWDDVKNFIHEYRINMANYENSITPMVLGIDTKCGTPILEIKNELRKNGKFDAECYSFTTDARYLIDLQTICGAYNTVCGAIGELPKFFLPDAFDYIVIDKDVNMYDEPYTVIENAYRLLKKGGQMFFSIKNTMDIICFVNCVGEYQIPVNEAARRISLEGIMDKLTNKGYNVKFLFGRQFDKGRIDKSVMDYVTACMKKVVDNRFEDSMSRLLADRYLFMISK